MVACQHQMYLAEYLDQLECVLFTRYCVANFKGPKFCWLSSNEIPTQNHTLLTKFDDVYRKLRKIDRFLSLSLSYGQPQYYPLLRYIFCQRTFKGIDTCKI